MYTDPVIDEIRKHRDEFAAKFNYDVKAMVDDIRHRQKASGRPTVSRKPNCVSTTEETEPKSNVVARPCNNAMNAEPE